MGYEEAREIVRENIEYDILVQDPRQDREQLDEVVDLMAETLCSRRQTIVVAGDEYPSEMVKEKLLRITASHIEYVFDCLKQNTTYVRNIKKYLLARYFRMAAFSSRPVSFVALMTSVTALFSTSSCMGHPSFVRDWINASGSLRSSAAQPVAVHIVVDEGGIIAAHGAGSIEQRGNMSLSPSRPPAPTRWPLPPTTRRSCAGI